MLITGSLEFGKAAAWELCDAVGGSLGMSRRFLDGCDAWSICNKGHTGGHRREKKKGYNGEEAVNSRSSRPASSIGWGTIKRPIYVYGIG